MRGMQIDENLWLCEGVAIEYSRNDKALVISTTFPPTISLQDGVLWAKGMEKAINAGFIKDMGYKGFELTEVGEAMMNLQGHNNSEKLGFSYVIRHQRSQIPDKIMGGASILPPDVILIQE